MCGIVGYIGKDNAIDNIYKILEKLEYRGYDSSGIAVLENDFLVYKKAGELEKLKSILPDKNYTFGIGHTRWATHGKPSDINAHPHTSKKGNVCVVHNGIIENYEKLQKKYKFSLKSQTDTEIIAELLEFYFNLPPRKRIEKVCSMLEGSYALAIIFRNEKDKIYCIKKHSPLVCSKNENGVFCSSDANALEDFSKDFYILKDNEIAILSENEIDFFCKDKKVTKKKFSLSENINKTDQKFCSLMEKEIYEIPKAIRETLFELNKFDVSKFKKLLSGIEHIYLVGCGTAYHSCLIGKYFFEKELGVFSSCEIASEFICPSRVINKKTLCIFVSQSGETSDTLKCINFAKEKGAKTFAITNTKNSSITFLCDNVFITQAGIERAVASTKAYVCQVAFFVYISKKLKNEKVDLTKFARRVYYITRECLKLNLDDILENFLSYKKIFFIGRGLDYFTAKEGSLKLKEITYINSLDIPAGELKHGTLALIDNESFVVVLLTQKSQIKKTLNSVFEIESRGAKVLIFTNFSLKIDKNNIIIKKLPTSENYSTMSTIIPIQKISLLTSKSLGYNPDKPRNLAKSVTVE